MTSDKPALELIIEQFDSHPVTGRRCRRSGGLSTSRSPTNQFSDVWKPVGPLPAAVYRRRRAVVLTSMIAVFALLPPTVGAVLQPSPAAGPAPPPEVADRPGGLDLSGVGAAPEVPATASPDAGRSAGATPARATDSTSPTAKTISRWFAVAAKLARRQALASAAGDPGGGRPEPDRAGDLG